MSLARQGIKLTMHTLRNGKLFRLIIYSKIDYRNIIPNLSVGSLERMGDKCSSLNQPLNWSKIIPIERNKN